MHIVLAVILLIGQTGARLPMGPEALSPARAEAVVDSVGREWIAARAAFQPHWATSVGIAGHEGDLALYARRSVGALTRKSINLKRELESFAADSLSLTAWIDREVLLADIRAHEFWFAGQAMWRRSPLPYTDAIIGGLAGLLMSEEGDVLAMHLASRMMAVPDLLAAARANITDPLELHCRVASSDLRGFMPLLKPEVLEHHFGGGASNTTLRLAQRTADSLAAFAEFIDSLAAGAEDNYALGEDYYVSFLADALLIEDPVMSILRQAERVLENAGAETGAEGMMGREAPEVKSTPEEIERAGLITPLPADRGLREVVFPLGRPAAAEAVYRPPGVADAAVYLLEKDDAYQAYPDYGSLWGLKTFRYAFPVQHLGEVRALRHESNVRRALRSGIARDGFVFYFEGVMADLAAGRETVGSLSAAVFAASAIAEIRIHTGELTVEEAADFISDSTGRPHDLALAEARRYAVAPGSGIGYLIGRMEILRLLDRYRKVKRNSFDIKEFHDTLLSCGYLPPHLLSIEVMSKAMGRE